MVSLADVSSRRATAVRTLEHVLRDLCIEQSPRAGPFSLALADGIVTRVVSDQPNNAIGTSPYPPAIATGGGNEVLVYLGDGIFTMYGHMLPGSVSLRVGDRVRRGCAALTPRRGRSRVRGVGGELANQLSPSTTFCGRTEALAPLRSRA